MLADETGLAAVFRPDPDLGKNYVRMSTQEKLAKATIAFNNTRFIRINGTNGPGGSGFVLDITPKPPGMPGNVVLRETSAGSVPNTELYAAGLDPEAEYRLSLTNFGDSNTWLELSSVEMWPG